MDDRNVLSSQARTSLSHDHAREDLSGPRFSTKARAIQGVRVYGAGSGESGITAERGTCPLTGPIRNRRIPAFR